MEPEHFGPTTLWVGVGDISKGIKETPRRTYYLLEMGQLKGAFKRGNKWCLRPARYVEELRKLEDASLNQVASVRKAAP